MYIIQNQITSELILATNMLAISEITEIPINKLHHTFSRKKENYFEYLEYRVYKKTPISNHKQKNKTCKTHKKQINTKISIK